MLVHRKVYILIKAVRIYSLMHINHMKTYSLICIDTASGKEMRCFKDDLRGMTLGSVINVRGWYMQ